MEIFISWSGEQSKGCAEALKDWLPKVINAVKPWISSADIDKGARWGQEISERLSTARFGIICLTPDNLHSDWILFEAGALSKAIDGSLTCTLLIGLTPSDVLFPMAQFQHTTVAKDDMLRLLKTINAQVSDAGLSEKHLAEAFEVWWPRLDQQLRTLPTEKIKNAQKRTDRDLLEEVLGLLRDQERRSGPVDERQRTKRREIYMKICAQVASLAGLHLKSLGIQFQGRTDELTIALSNDTNIVVSVPRPSSLPGVRGFILGAFRELLSIKRTQQQAEPVPHE